MLVYFSAPSTSSGSSNSLKKDNTNNNNTTHNNDNDNNNKNNNDNNNNIYVHTYTMLDIFPAYPTTNLVTSMAHHGHHNGSLAGPVYSYSDGRGNDFNISLMVKVTQHAMRDVNHAVRYISR